MNQNLPSSVISARSETVIPRSVLDRLGVRPGDSLRYVDTPEGILIEKAPPDQQNDPFATFTEWSTDADEKAYADL